MYICNSFFGAFSFSSENLHTVRFIIHIICLFKICSSSFNAVFIRSRKTGDAGVEFSANFRDANAIARKGNALMRLSLEC